MAGFLLPLLGGKVGEYLVDRISDKLDIDSAKDKAKNYIKNKVEASSIGTAKNRYQERTLLNKKGNLQKKLASAIEELWKLKENGASQVALEKKLKEVTSLESQLEDVQDSLDEKGKKEARLKKELEKRVGKKGEVPAPSKPKKKKIASENVGGKKTKPRGKGKLPVSTKTSVADGKKKAKPAGRPTGSKSKPKTATPSVVSTGMLGGFGGRKASASVDDFSLETGIGDLGTDVDIQKKGKDKEFKETLINGTSEQIVLLGEIKDELKEVSEKIGALDGVGSNVVDSLLKGGLKGKLFKSLLKFVPKAAVGLGVAGVAATVADVGVDYMAEKKELKRKLDAGEITKEEYDKLNKRNGIKSSFRGGGALGGAAYGAALGSFAGPVGTAIGAGVGALGGMYLGGKAGDKAADMRDYLATTAYLESGFNPNAKAGTSSAAGMFQFTKGTWENMIKKHGLNYTQEDRFDPTKSAQVAALFAQENKRTIEKGTGREASGTDMYMGHFLGAGGAVNFLNAKKNRGHELAANDPKFKQAAEANKSIFYNKDGTPRSFNEVYSLMDNKYKKGQEKSQQLLAKSQVLPQAKENEIALAEAKKPEQSKGVLASETKKAEPKALAEVKNESTIIQKDIGMSKEEKEKLLRDQRLRKYQGTQYGTALASSMPNSVDTPMLKNVDKVVTEFDAKQEKEKKQLASNTASPQGNTTVVNNNVSKSESRGNVAQDDYISAGIRWSINA